MAKKAFTIDEVDLKKLPRSQQRRFLDLGMVKAAPKKAEAK